MFLRTDIVRLCPIPPAGQGISAIMADVPAGPSDSAVSHTIRALPILFRTFPKGSDPDRTERKDESGWNILRIAAVVPVIVYVRLVHEGIHLVMSPRARLPRQVCDQPCDCFSLSFRKVPRLPFLLEIQARGRGQLCCLWLLHNEKGRLVLPPDRNR